MSQRLSMGVIAVFALGLAIWLLGFVVSGPLPGTTATGLLGIDLPASAREERLAIKRYGFGEYRAYIRLVVDPADVPALLTDPAFQPQNQAAHPLAVFNNTSMGGRPISVEVLQSRPEWWWPEAGTRFILAYRSPPGPGPGYRGPDAAWYIIDTSDPAQAVVHVYVLEV